MSTDEISRLTAALAEAEGRAERAETAASELSKMAIGANAKFDAEFKAKHAANARIAELEVAFVELYKLCCTLGNFKNGVEHNGIDEGEVYASGVFDRAEAALRIPYFARSVLKEARGG